MGYKTEQEEFWAGEFGDQYIDRNPANHVLPGRIALFSRILRRTQAVSSILELGANVGSNLLALRQLLPEASLSAVEINERAVKELKKIGDISVFHGSILDFNPVEGYEFVFVSGVLIHIAPDALPRVYDLMVKSSRRYVCIIEYYNPTPVEVPYRGHRGKLFKRDFAGELMERHSGMRLVDYGFVYHRDPNFPLDDLTWFLMEK